MTFHVGQKVVCVDNSMEAGSPRWLGMAYPEVGPIYTIREIHDRGSAPASILLAEIVNPPHVVWRIELGFCSSRFRPITERKTDISIFKKLLQPNSKIIERV